jgi:hypothetical protein
MFLFSYCCSLLGGVVGCPICLLFREGLRPNIYYSPTLVAMGYFPNVKVRAFAGKGFLENSRRRWFQGQRKQTRAGEITK